MEKNILHQLKWLMSKFSEFYTSHVIHDFFNSGISLISTSSGSTVNLEQMIYVCDTPPINTMTYPTYGFHWILPNMRQLFSFEICFVFFGDCSNFKLGMLYWMNCILQYHIASIQYSIKLVKQKWLRPSF